MLKIIWKDVPKISQLKLYIFTHLHRHEQKEVKFLVEQSYFELRIFLLLDWLPCQSDKTLIWSITYLYLAGGINVFQSFLMTWNVNSFFQDLNNDSPEFTKTHMNIKRSIDLKKNFPWFLLN